MCEKLLFVASLIAFVHVTNGGLAPFITKCATTDSKCMKQSADVAIPIFAAGIPELGVETLDPIHFEKIDASSKDLHLILTDVTITGLKNCVAKKVEHNSAKSKMIVKLLCSPALDGHYNMSGRSQIIPMEGDGKIKIDVNKLLLAAEADIEEKVKDGKLYWAVKEWKHSYELKSKAKIELENLFSGNEVLGRTAKELLKSNPNDVFDEVAPPVMQVMVTRIVKAIKHFFDKVPLEELVLD